MSEESPLRVLSEIGNLKKVLIHRPGREIERLIPDLLDKLLFDDIPFLKIAQKEHNRFAQILQENDVEVVYLEDLLAETLKKEEIRRKFINQFLNEGGVVNNTHRKIIKEYLSELQEKELVIKLMEGIRKKEVPQFKNKTLSNMVNQDYPFLLDPMPNLYFTRDPFATIGDGISLNHMRSETRNRETIFPEYIFKYHPEFGQQKTQFYYNRYEKTSIEGGDILVLNKEVLAVGISQRTDAASVEKLAHNIFTNNLPFSTILAFQIPSKRAFMHLDTVFTMVDFDKFTIHAEIEGPLRVFSITEGENNDLVIEEEKAVLKDILKKYLKLDDINLIRCAGGDYIDGGREQWNDGSNTLAIAPGEVIVYSRNYVTNQLLKENGIKIHTMPSSELSRGRGGPRCMSMPLVREDLNIN